MSPLRSALRRLRNDIVLNGLAAHPLVPRRARRAILLAVGVHVDKGVLMHPRCWFGGTDVSFGYGTWVNYGVWFDNSAPITIGRNVSIGQQVLFCTSSHAPGTHNKRAGKPTAAPITVGDGCWIGSRAVILPGVTLSDGVVVGAGSVVTSDCAPDGLYAGAPARLIRQI